MIEQSLKNHPRSNYSENEHFSLSRYLCPLLYFFLELSPQIAAPSAFTNSSFSSYRSPFHVPSTLETGRSFWTKPQTLVVLTDLSYFFFFPLNMSRTFLFS